MSENLVIKSFTRIARFSRSHISGLEIRQSRDETAFAEVLHQLVFFFRSSNRSPDTTLGRANPEFCSSSVSRLERPQVF